MPIWEHTECGDYIDGPDEPMECPFGEIPTCQNPTEGFDNRCANVSPIVWKCKSCGWLVRGGSAPEVCPAGSSLPDCPDPTGGSFNDIC